ncbi:MAG TPA: diadenylate cyclase CdaA [Anaerolineae bacterium]|nr:diadenylate cyclase CdaA [Anaerolineae bacterium]
MSDILPILSRLDLISIVDILLVALIFYWILTLIQGTQAVQLLRGILILAVLALIMASAFERLTAFGWLINKAVPALLVAIPIIFQPELRRALDRVGRTSKIFASPRSSTQIEKAIYAVSEAVIPMSQVRHGALIVFERNTGLEDYVETGVRLEASVSSDLLATIFSPNTPLHDGGAIIRGDRILAAAVVFPLSGETAINRQQWLGTRHQAALGISQITDAIAVVVSEESGIISVAHNGQLIRGLDKKRLEQILIAFYKSELAASIPGWQYVGQTILIRLRLIKAVKSVSQARPQSKQ